MKQHLLDSKAQSIVYRGEHGLKTFEKIIIMSLNVECCVFTLVEPEVFYSAPGSLSLLTDAPNRTNIVTLKYYFYAISVTELITLIGKECMDS